MSHRLQSSQLIDLSFFIVLPLTTDLHWTTFDAQFCLPQNLDSLLGMLIRCDHNDNNENKPPVILRIEFIVFDPLECTVPTVVCANQSEYELWHICLSMPLVLFHQPSKFSKFCCPLVEPLL